MRTSLGAGSIAWCYQVLNLFESPVAYGWGGGFVSYFTEGSQGSMRGMVGTGKLAYKGMGLDAVKRVERYKESNQGEGWRCYDMSAVG